MQWWEFCFRLGQTCFAWSVWLAEHIPATFEKSYFQLGLKRWTRPSFLAPCLWREKVAVAPGTATGCGWDPLTLWEGGIQPLLSSPSSIQVWLAVANCLYHSSAVVTTMLTHSMLSVLYLTFTPSFPYFPAQGTLAESLHSSLLSPHLSLLPHQHTGTMTPLCCPKKLSPTCNYARVLPTSPSKPARLHVGQHPGPNPQLLLRELLGAPGRL